MKLSISTSHHHQWRLESTHLTFSLTLLQKTRSVPLSKTPTILKSRLFGFLGSQLNATHALIPESLGSGGMTQAEERQSCNNWEGRCKWVRVSSECREDLVEDGPDNDGAIVGLKV